VPQPHVEPWLLRAAGHRGPAPRPLLRTAAVPCHRRRFGPRLQEEEDWGDSDEIQMGTVGRKRERGECGACALLIFCRDKEETDMCRPAPVRTTGFQFFQGRGLLSPSLKMSTYLQGRVVPSPAPEDVFLGTGEILQYPIFFRNGYICTRF